jgi:hypothetical protein
MKNYTILWKGQQRGPFSKEEVCQMIGNGEVRAVHTILRDGTAVPLEELVPPAPAPTSAVPPHATQSTARPEPGKPFVPPPVVPVEPPKAPERLPVWNDGEQEKTSPSSPVDPQPPRSFSKPEFPLRSKAGSELRPPPPPPPPPPPQTQNSYAHPFQQQPTYMMPPPPPGPVQGYTQSGPRKTSGLAVASLVLGIVSLLGGAFFVVPPILAVIFGHCALSTCNSDPSVQGQGMARAGLIMGWICIGIYLAVLLLNVIAIASL